MDEKYVTTRVTNPGETMAKKHPRNMTAKEKSAWARRMAAARRKKSGTTRRRRRSRKKNPADVKIAGVSAKSALKDVGGVAAGVAVGGYVANILSRFVSKMPGGRYGLVLGNVIAGVALVMTGHYMAKKYRTLPLLPFAAAMSYPVVAEGVDALMGRTTTVQAISGGEQVAVDVDTTSGRVRRIRGRTASGTLVARPQTGRGTMYKAPMSGTITRGNKIPMGRAYTRPTL
jgi:hypothetical protein